MYIYIYIYTYVYMYLSLYIYIYTHSDMHLAETVHVRVCFFTLLRLSVQITRCVCHRFPDSQTFIGLR